MNKVLYTGTKDNKVYWTDDKDSLPADIENFAMHGFKDFSYSSFLVGTLMGEERGFEYNIQIGELFYETPEE